MRVLYTYFSVFTNDCLTEAVCMNQDDIGVSGVVGSAVFNITLVIAVCALAAPRAFTLHWYSVCRYDISLSFSIFLSFSLFLYNSFLLSLSFSISLSFSLSLYLYLSFLLSLPLSLSLSLPLTKFRFLDMCSCTFSLGNTFLHIFLPFSLPLYLSPWVCLSLSLSISIHLQIFV